MKKATPNRFLTAGRPGVFKVKMSLGRAMKTTDLNGGLPGVFGSMGHGSGPEHNCERVLEQRCAASAKLEVELELNERLR